MSPVHCRFVLVLAILMLATALGASTAYARDSEKQWEFGAFGTESRYSNSTNVKSAAGYGLRVGYHLKANVEFELDYDKSSSDSVNQANVSYDVTKYVPRRWPHSSSSAWAGWASTAMGPARTRPSTRGVAA